MYNDTRAAITHRVFVQASAITGVFIVIATVLAAVAGNRIIGDVYTHGVKVFVLPLMGIGAVLGVGLLVRLVREQQLPHFLARTWPLFLLVATDVAVLAVTAARFDGSPQRQYVFYLNFLFIRLLGLAAFFAGLAVSKWKWDAARIVVFATMLAAAAFGVFEFYNYLNPNVFGSLLIAWNERSYEFMWLFLDRETGRAMGLEIDPNFYASTAVIGIAYALAARIPMSVRVAIISLAGVMLMLSQSRTAVFAVILLVAVFIAWRLYAHGWQRWLRRDARILALLFVGIAIAGGVLWALDKPDPITARIEASIDLAEDSSRSIAIVDALTNGRGTIWVKVWDSYLEQPGGSFEATVKDVGRNAHNEALDRLHWGGPVMALAFLIAVVWMVLCVRTPHAPAFGVLAGASLVVIGLMLQPTHLPGVMTLTMFLLGTFASHEWLIGDGSFVSLSETKGI